ncbi:unnamed protein product [Cuscuta campestris]|uniref:Uncharacterized protein n=1 Tax=Cuscuta campestris TaxID=132261 RepID=A0A484K429_9ASTE|nr:unnamed protein product [Cuscuta campestris]
MHDTLHEQSANRTKGIHINFPRTNIGCSGKNIPSGCPDKGPPFRKAKTYNQVLYKHSVRQTLGDINNA